MRAIDYHFLFGETARKPVDGSKLLTWPRHGMHISGLIVNRKCNIKETIRIFADCGVTLTDVNWLSAVWPELVKDGVFPWKRTRPPFDLFDWNIEFFDRAQEVVERCNAAGIVVQGTLWELYSWSNRKKGPGIPDANQGPWRANTNGILLGGKYNGDRHEDDETLGRLIPTPWCVEFLPLILTIWDATINPVRIGNEMPEKSLHQRVARLIRTYEPKALITVNRNEDTPGQYANHKIGTSTDWDRLEYHGLKAKSLRPVKDAKGAVKWPQGDLDRFYPTSVSSVPTFRTLLDDKRVDKSRITFSSDGARISDSPVNPYDWPKLREWFREVKRRGCSILHQSRAKMSPAPNEEMIESEWFASVIR